MSFETEDGIQAKSRFQYSDVLGRVIQCEDGKKRKVESITPSTVYVDMVVINEHDEEDRSRSPKGGLMYGAFCHILSLSCQMLGDPMPSEDLKRAFSKGFSGIKFVEDHGETPPPEGVVLPIEKG